MPFTVTSKRNTKFRFVPRQERGTVKKGRKERKKERKEDEGWGELVNNTKRQVARKRRYFSGCTRAPQRPRSNKNERGPVEEG